VIEKDAVMKIETGNTGMRAPLAAMFAWVAIGTSGCLAAGGGAPPALDPQVVHDWSGHARTVLQAETGNQDPLVGTRSLAMVHLAMHDAVNAVDRQYQPYAYATPNAQADAVAAAATAAHRVLAALFPAQAASLDARLADSLAAVPDGSAETKGIALGQQVAAEILQRRANDGSAGTVGYTPGAGAGRFQFVPPFEGVIFRPEWRFVTPFALASASQFRSGPPPALESAEYRNAFDEVKATGVLAGSNRSADQTAYAKFWYEDCDIGWNRITHDVALRRKLPLHDTARLFALVNVALADAYIAGWDSKFHHDFWRPVTAIRAAAAAAAFVLASVLGDDNEFSLTSSTAEVGGQTRSFRRFSEAADENADSRAGTSARPTWRGGPARCRRRQNRIRSARPGWQTARRTCCRSPACG
jgi:hypothetical protein